MIPTCAIAACGQCHSLFAPERVERIVANGPKGRFLIRRDLNNRISGIRAAQGHSDPRVGTSAAQTQIGESWFTQRPQDVRAFAWHGTFPQHLEAILKEGLIPGGPQHRRNEVHLSPYPPGDQRIIAGMRFESTIALRINFRALHDSGMPLYESAAGAILVPQTIPREYVTQAYRVADGKILFEAVDLAESDDEPDTPATTKSEAGREPWPMKADVEERTWWEKAGWKGT